MSEGAVTTTTRIYDDLAARLSDGALSVARARREQHARDMSPIAPSSVPDAVVTARSEADVVETLRFAHAHRVPVVPQGARTGVCGGAVAGVGSIALSLHAMTRIRAIDAPERLATVEPGVLNATLSRAVGEQGLFYPPDPASWEISSIGGNVATDAGGLCCLKYGVTSEYVRRLRVVLADGEVITTGRRTRKGVAGYDMTGLFVGSEGTLGVITEITVALEPAPAAPVTAAAFFPSVETAAAAVFVIHRSPLRPSLLELLDGRTLEAVAQALPYEIPSAAGAMLIAQCDGEAAEQEHFLREIQATFTAHGAVDVAVGENEQENEMLLAARRGVHTAAERLGAVLTDDVCVPIARIGDFATGAQRLASATPLRLHVAGHAGDGNLHTTIVFPRGDEAAARSAHELSERIARFGLSLGGTISGEHGIGRLKVGLLPEEIGAAGLQAQRSIKQALDPRNILNPGAVLA